MVGKIYPWDCGLVVGYGGGSQVGVYIRGMKGMAAGEGGVHEVLGIGSSLPMHAN